MIEFRLFGVPVQVQPGFWLMASLFGLNLLIEPGENKLKFPVWIGIVFLSILVHEFGHAIAILRHRLEPAVTLHTMGGLTSWSRPGRMGRLDRGIIAFAGPLAGFLLAGLIYAFVRFGPDVALPELAAYALETLLFVNIYWGILNLMPVLPFDGGHILEEAMGPKRRRATAMVSMAFGAALALFFVLVLHSLIGALIFGMGAMRSYQELQAAGPAPRAQAALPHDGEPLPTDVARQLAAARAALDEDAHAHARTIAELLLSANVPARARIDAHEIVAWSHVLEGDLDAAARALRNVEREGGHPDAALVAAFLRGRGELDAARKVLETARAAGDERKTIVGPLIQILIAQREIARAAAVAYDIVESLSDDDVRHMTDIAADAKSYPWASRLAEALFRRGGAADDAYAAARFAALAGEETQALTLLRQAVAAGFSDTARAWSDAALASLREGAALAELEALLPKR